jgi:hypothetical protein
MIPSGDKKVRKAKKVAPQKVEGVMIPSGDKKVR